MDAVLDAAGATYASMRPRHKAAENFDVHRGIGFQDGSFNEAAA